MYELDTPFNHQKLESLMDQFSVDVLVVTSKHNVRYLLGGYEAFFYQTHDATGISRYLPALVLVRGDLGKAAYFGARSEKHQIALDPIWPEIVNTTFSTSAGVAEAVAKYIKSIGLETNSIGFEYPFLPHDAAEVFLSNLPHAKWSNAVRILELLRLVKNSREIDLLRRAAEGVVTAINETFDQISIGAAKNEIVSLLKRNEEKHSLAFDYCLINIGCDPNRYGGPQRLQKNEVIALDSGGNLLGYIGDVVRMGYSGIVDQELTDLLAEVDRIQYAAIGAMISGERASAIFEMAHAAIDTSFVREHINFLAHGIGLVSHEAPRLTARGPVPYPADDESTILVPGITVSVETTLVHPSRGFIKLEDTVAVTSGPAEVFAEGGRAWHPIK